MKNLVIGFVVINALVWLLITKMSLKHYLNGTLAGPVHTSIDKVIFFAFLVVINCVTLYYLFQNKGDRRN